MKPDKAFSVIILVALIISLPARSWAQINPCINRKIPQLTDILAKTGIKFVHASAPEKKYILESMSGGVLLLDYNRDGLLDIYFTNAPSVDMALKGQRARS